MPGDDKDGYYCSICGGIPLDKITTKQIQIDGKMIGIDHLDFIVEQVKQLHLTDDAAIVSELMKRVKAFNYVPSKKEALYADALLREYRQRKDA
jgi:hypothetical protein